MNATKTISKSSNLIPIKIGLIDSLKLCILLSDCEILNKQLLSETSIYYHDLEWIDKELILPPKPYEFVVDGVMFRVHIKHIPQWNKEKNEHESIAYIEIVLTCKLLRERYFEGINIKNILHFYESFMSFNIFKCTYESFLEAKVSDIDVCVNIYSHNKNVFVDVLNTLYRQSGTKQKHIRPPIIESSNIGLQFSNRVGAKPSLPFLKFYHKELELLSKSSTFYNDYLFPKYDESIKNLTRIEATIKNHKHKLRLEKFSILPKFKTLSELLQISSDDFLRFINFSLGAYITQTLRMKAPELSPTDHIIYELLQNNIIDGHSLESIITILRTYKGATKRATENAKSRMKNRLNNLYDLLIEKDVKIASKNRHNNHVLEYLNFLNLKI